MSVINILFTLHMILLVAIISGTSGASQFPSTVVIEDFEDYRTGDTPYRWKKVRGRTLIKADQELERDRDYFEIIEEQGNHFVRVFVDNESTQIVKPKGDGLVWSLKHHPVLSWDWRAHRLPENANEERSSLNDTGAAVYVTFSTDFIGRPRAIKYTYSSTLPEGTIVSYGRLKVIVVSTQGETTGSWVRIERNVYDDFRKVFNGEPPDEPVALALWSDSDNTKTIATVDFDNIEVHRSPNPGHDDQ